MCWGDAARGEGVAATARPCCQSHSDVADVAATTDAISMVWSNCRSERERGSVMRTMTGRPMALQFRWCSTTADVAMEHHRLCNDSCCDADRDGVDDGTTTPVMCCAAADVAMEHHVRPSVMRYSIVGFPTTIALQAAIGMRGCCVSVVRWYRSVAELQWSIIGATVEHRRCFKGWSQRRRVAITQSSSAPEAAVVASVWWVSVFSMWANRQRGYCNLRVLAGASTHAAREAGMQRCSTPGGWRRCRETCTCWDGAMAWFIWPGM